MPGLNADFLSDEEVARLGLAKVGPRTRIHSTCVLVNCGAIRIGADVRIDPFVVISAGEGVRIGRNVHIAAQATIIGAAPVEVGDFTGLSQGVRVLSSSDDFSGSHLTGPTVPAAFRSVRSERVRFGRHALIGAGAVVLPGADVGEGAAVGALSLVRGDLAAWTIHAGSPTRALGPRSDRLLALEAQLRAAEMPGPPDA